MATLKSTDSKKVFNDPKFDNPLTKTPKKDLKLSRDIGSKIKQEYYKKKIKQQEARLKLLEKNVKEIMPPSDYKISYVISAIYHNLQGFIRDIKLSKNPRYIINSAIREDRPLYLGLFGIIVFSFYLILKSVLVY